MAYSKAKLQAMAIKHLLVSDHSEQEMYQTSILLKEFDYRFRLNTFS
jgi:hypothetical protein